MRGQRVSVLKMLADVLQMLDVARIKPPLVAVVIRQRHAALVKLDDRAERAVVKVVALVVAPRDHTVTDSPLELLALGTSPSSCGRSARRARSARSRIMSFSTRAGVVLGDQRDVVHPPRMLRTGLASPVERVCVLNVDAASRISR